MFTKLLIANRGEIAVRVIRACREMGIRTVAVYSEVDRKALHVLRADEAYCIGPAAPTESYLRIDKIIDAARRSGAQAIHPGYGFLSENPALPRACDEVGITFIGPSAAAMEAMGSKTRARQLMREAGVPVVPGTTSAVESPEEANRVAEAFGYPVMIKAAAGGGGKGMRAVRSADEMPSAFRDARSESQNAFNDSEVYIEKLIENTRHIEIQVLGDQHGNMAHLGERECSVQRRHQKVIEESPSPFVDAEMRRRMGEAAVKAAQAAGYYNAGTVEFLVDSERNFYFLEMNTRLQVEHPVTELVTGLDLVKEQIRISAGEKLSFAQHDITFRGAALECRIYAEDPENNFFPSPGMIETLETPSGPGVRDDSGVYPGWTVPTEYDPLISKLITWGVSRDEAIARMRRALGEYSIQGIKTNLAFFRRILRFPDFVVGRLDTGLIERMLACETERNQPAELDMDALRAVAVAAAVQYAGDVNESQAATTAQQSSSRWKLEGRRELVQHQRT
jgi:acetyl-CoA carboxylase, biotin carboxylase subunit